MFPNHKHKYFTFIVYRLLKNLLIYEYHVKQLKTKKQKQNTSIWLGVKQNKSWNIIIDTNILFATSSALKSLLYNSINTLIFKSYFKGQFHPDSLCLV